jgi:phosphoribosylformylglycinamidine synthase
MSRVHVLVVSGYGANSQMESAHAARLAGADRADVAHFADIAAGDARLADYQLLVFPGGFLDGDDLGAAQAAAQRWLYSRDAEGVPMLEHLRTFLDEGKLMLGICNGFQLMVKLGLLPSLGGRRFERQVSLSHNASARFENRWVRLAVNPLSPCVFTRGLGNLTMPVRHGEGRLAALDDAVLDRLEEENLVPLVYADPETGRATEAYPANPNGSPRGIAGLTDPTGRLLGLMPHPEAFNHRTNAPRWTRGEYELPGVALFENAVRYLR